MHGGCTGVQILPNVFGREDASYADQLDGELSVANESGKQPHLRYRSAANGMAANASRFPPEHVATVAVDLLGAKTRASTLDDIATLWRAEIGALPGVSSLILTEPGIGPQGIAVQLRLTHPDLAALEAAGRATLAELETYAGVRNAILDLRPGEPELRLNLSPGAEGLGLTATDVAGQLRAAFLGTQLSEIRRGDLAWDIEVRLARETSGRQLADTRHCNSASVRGQERNGFHNPSANTDVCAHGERRSLDS